jgi:hypothetical protein
MKKELNLIKEKNPFLYLIEISKNKTNKKEITLKKQKEIIERSFTPIQLIKNKNIKKTNLNLFENSTSNIKEMGRKTNISQKFKNKTYHNNQNLEVQKLKKQIKILKKELNNKNKEYKKSKEEIDNLKNENINLKNQIEQCKEKIEKFSKEEHAGKETILYHYLVEMNNQILQSLNDNSPNVDNMTYEELLALEDQIGYVNKGFKKEEIQKIKSEKYNFDEVINCVICLDDIKKGEIIKKLNCNHIFHINCIDTWLSKEKNCPFCKNEICIH